MTRRMLVALAASAVLFLGASPAAADHDYGGGYDGGEYDDRRGDCRGTKGHCEDNDFSPSFQDSPVRDAFNFSPQICLPGATCHFEDRRPDERQGQQPTAGPPIACLVPFPYHCDPKPH